MRIFIGFLIGTILTFLLLFKFGSHAKGLRGQLEFEVCNSYYLCYGHEWVNCESEGYNCEMDQMWVIYTDDGGQIPLRFLGVKELRYE